MEERRRCAKCGLKRPVSAFQPRRRGSTRRQSYCRTCKAAYQRDWYERNRERHGAGVKRLRAAYTARNRRVILKAKSVPCADCGVQYPPYVMDFDHVRGDKVDLVTRLAVRPVPLLQLLQEIAKCEVVCANCHRLRTFRRGWPRPGSRARRGTEGTAPCKDLRQLRLEL